SLQTSAQTGVSDSDSDNYINSLKLEIYRGTIKNRIVRPHLHKCGYEQIAMHYIYTGTVQKKVADLWQTYKRRITHDTT
ncbi:Hypothetical predicted protein, partial [Pelobates cultripes]